MERQGFFVNNLNGYKSFKPSNLQNVEKTLNLDVDIYKSIQKIREKLIKINLMSEYVENTDLFLYAYVYEEALESSRIEGTECTMEDLFENINKENKNAPKNINDIKETISNINAIERGIELLNEIPLSTKLYKEIHKILLNNVRGKKKNPGELRTSQNWVGGNALKDAIYIPPNVDDMNEALNEFDKYINCESEVVDKLIKCALIHYQFETIHPFLDGNGRLGRILILLYLMKEKLLEKPYIYMSYYLKINQMEYYNKMMEVRKNGKYEEYIKFFLNCLDAAEDSVIKKMNIINELHKRNIAKIPSTTRKKDTHNIVFNYIEKYPIFTLTDIVKITRLSFNTAYKVVENFEKQGIVKRQNGDKRNRLFLYDEYLNIFKRVN